MCVSERVCVCCGGMCMYMCVYVWPACLVPLTRPDTHVVLLCCWHFLVRCEMRHGTNVAVLLGQGSHCTQKSECTGTLLTCTTTHGHT